MVIGVSYKVAVSTIYYYIHSSQHLIELACSLMGILDLSARLEGWHTPF